MRCNAIVMQFSGSEYSNANKYSSIHFKINFQRCTKQ